MAFINPSAVPNTCCNTGPKTSIIFFASCTSSLEPPICNTSKLDKSAPYQVAASVQTFARAGTKGVMVTACSSIKSKHSSNDGFCGITKVAPLNKTPNNPGHDKAKL